MTQPELPFNDSDNRVYYKWTHKVDGNNQYSTGHIASPAPFNERWDIVQISKEEYDKDAGN